MKEKLTDQEAIDSQMAYYNTFLTDEQGKAVLCDMMKAAGMFGIIESNCEAEQLVLSNFIKTILKKCGVDDPMAMINAYAVIAKGWRPPAIVPEQGPLETNDNLLS